MAAIDEGKKVLGRGWGFPVVFDPFTGTVASAAYEEDIRQSIRIIIGTGRGERVMRPDFGCGIHDLVFTAMDTTALTRVEETVRDALTRFEPRIELLQIRATGDEAVNGKLLVEIDYRVRATNQTGNLVYPFYFREGAQR
ncbi:phage baseplate assembly protein W [Bradyrhizobium sp. AZCC 1588]|uniref:GPW/gp25 family protein n=1 Tax=unclassified Bradyrhizobium TaxID=2631580 RepID=UPI002FEFC741